MADGVLQLPCLGKPFHLGMLYDSRNQMIIPGITLWNHKTVTSCQQSRPQPSSNFEVITEDSIRNKTSVLDVKGELKASFLCGKVSVSGSAKYLGDNKTSNQQARVSLKYSSTSHFEELSMEQLSEFEFKDGLRNECDATHVVTGLVYGSDAIFVFDRTVDKTEDIQTISGNMEVIIKSIPGGLSDIEASVSLKLDSKDVDESKKFTCTFYGDVILPFSPSTYTEAIRVYNELPGLIKGNTVPKTVYLYPLAKLDNDNRIVRSIQDSFISQIEEVMESFQNHAIRAGDLRKHAVCSTFGDIKDELTLFLTSLERHKMEFKMELSDILPKIRGGAEDAGLFKLLKEVQDSRFSHATMESFVQSKEKEVRMLDQDLQNMRKEPRLERAISDDLELLVRNRQYKYVVCFAYNVTVKKCNIEEVMEPYMKPSGDAKFYAEDMKVAQRLRRMVMLYQEFATENAERTDLAFAVVDKYQSTDPSAVGGDQTSRPPQPVIILYTEEDDPRDGFVPPSKPQTLQHENAGEDFVHLKWSAPKHGGDFVEHYDVQYWPNGSSETRSVKSTIDREEKLLMEGLLPGTEYCFAVMAVSEPGVSRKSDTCKVCTCPAVERPADTLMDDFYHRKGTSFPEIYFAKDLKPLLENEGFARFSIGNSTPTFKPKADKVLMLVGGTKADAGMLVNGMANYVLGVKWEDTFRFELVTKNEVGPTEKRSIAYTFDICTLPFNLTIVHIPDIDPLSEEYDETTVKSQIQHIFPERDNRCAIDLLHGICFVVPAFSISLPEKVRHTFAAVLGTFDKFGKDRIADNVFFMITCATARSPPVLDAVKDFEKKGSFRFDNAAVFARNGSAEYFNSMLWRMDHQSFVHFFNMLFQASPLSLSREDVDTRERDVVLVSSLLDQIEVGLLLLETVEEEGEAIQKHTSDIIEGRQFSYPVKILKRREKKLLSDHVFVTNCKACGFTCHSGCTISEDSEKSKCCAMVGGECIICPRKCLSSEHCNMRFSYEYYFDGYERGSCEDLKKKYSLVGSEKDGSKSATGSEETEAAPLAEVEHMKRSYERTFKQLQRDVILLMQRAQKAHEHLDESVLEFSTTTSTLDPLARYIKRFIEEEEMTQKTGWKDRVKQYKKICKVISEDSDWAGWVSDWEKWWPISEL